MSTYATVLDLSMYGAPASALDSIDTTAQQAALDSAATLADGYLRSKFTLPIVTASIDLKEAVCKIATYTLLSVRGYNPESGSDTNIRDRYRDAIAWLRGVSEGSITPALIDSSPAGTIGGPRVLQAQLSSLVTNSDGSAAVLASAPSARGW